MKTIYKYRLQIEHEQKIALPEGAVIVHTGLDTTGVPCLWAMVNTDAKLLPVNIFIYGTGMPIEVESLLHVGSFTQSPFVWHVFRN
jgi:hypothetical protein